MHHGSYRERGKVNTVLHSKDSGWVDVVEFAAVKKKLSACALPASTVSGLQVRRVAVGARRRPDGIRCVLDIQRGRGREREPGPALPFVEYMANLYGITR
jgi:hypothetical protein